MENTVFLLFNLFFWIFVIILIFNTLIGLILGPLFYDEGTPWTFLFANAIVGVFTIWFAPRTNILTLLCLFFAAAVNLAFFILASKRQKRIFKIGSHLGRETLPLNTTSKPIREPTPASILDPIIKARLKINEPPPVGYWSVVFPNPMQFGQEHVVKINFSAFTNDSKERDDWLEAMRIAFKNSNEAILSITPVSQSFEVKPSSREISIQLGRSLTTDFFVTPTQLGKHPIRIEVHLGKTPLGWFQETIRVHINFHKGLATIAATIGIIATILSILGALKVLP